MKIAIVDDEHYVRKLLKRSLERDRHLVDSFEDGRRFLDRVADGKRYDLILLDIVMPGINGIQVFESLKEKGGSMPAVIFISAFDFTGKLKHVIDNSSVWYLPKPFGLEELRAGVEKARAFTERIRRCQSTEVLQLREHTLLREASQDTIPPV